MQICRRSFLGPALLFAVLGGAVESHAAEPYATARARATRALRSTKSPVSRKLWQVMQPRELKRPFSSPCWRRGTMRAKDARAVIRLLESRRAGDALKREDLVQLDHYLAWAFIGRGPKDRRHSTYLKYDDHSYTVTYRAAELLRDYLGAHAGLVRPNLTNSSTKLRGLLVPSLR